MTNILNTYCQKTKYSIQLSSYFPFIFPKSMVVQFPSFTIIRAGTIFHPIIFTIYFLASFINTTGRFCYFFMSFRFLYFLFDFLNITSFSHYGLQQSFCSFISSTNLFFMLIFTKRYQNCSSIPSLFLKSHLTWFINSPTGFLMSINPILTILSFALLYRMYNYFQLRNEMLILSSINFAHDLLLIIHFSCYDDVMESDLYKINSE